MHEGLRKLLRIVDLEHRVGVVDADVHVANLRAT
jgi:hypothetical protein